MNVTDLTTALTNTNSILTLDAVHYLKILSAVYNTQRLKVLF
jgi:hypothetical protein